MFDLVFFNMNHLHQSYEVAQTMPAVESLRFQQSWYEEIELFLSHIVPAAPGQKGLIDMSKIPNPKDWVRKPKGGKII